MNAENGTETIGCPSCDESDGTLWATESGFSAVKCTACGL